jgi:hypothetical protein
MERREVLDAPVRSEADLCRLWQTLMGPGGFGQRTLWLLFLAPDGYPCKVIVPIEDLPAEPDAQFVGNLHSIVTSMGPDVGTVPLLLSRPGRANMTASDRRWASALRTDAPPEVLRWPVHLATCDRIQVFAPDDLIAAS